MGFFGVFWRLEATFDQFYILFHIPQYCKLSFFLLLLSIRKEKKGVNMSFLKIEICI